MQVRFNVFVRLSDVDEEPTFDWNAFHGTPWDSQQMLDKPCNGRLHFVPFLLGDKLPYHALISVSNAPCPDARSIILRVPFPGGILIAIPLNTSGSLVKNLFEQMPTPARTLSHHQRKKLGWWR